MELILWRHAEAVEPAPDQPDLERRLTVLGEQQALHVAQWFHQHRHKHLHILVSPAIRCQQTANALALPFDIDRRIGPSAAAADLIAAANGPASARNGVVMLVGHQPTLGRLAALLLSGNEADWHIKKGALWWFSNRIRGTKGQTILKTVISPNMI